MSREAFAVFKALKSRSHSRIKETLIEVLSYLEKLTGQVCPNGLSHVFICDWTFKNELSSDKDIKSYHKANLFSAKESLNRILLKIEEVQIGEVMNRMLLDFICDLKPSITYFDQNQYYSWLVGNTNTQISNFYYDLSESIFWNGVPGQHPQEKIVLAASTPFVIRQSIEYKIKRILGIDYILLKNGRPDIQAMKKCFSAIEANKIYYNTTNFNFEIIQKIHSWTHAYIHGGYRPEPWKTETALYCLKNLFYEGANSTNPNSFSWYAGVEVFDYNLDKLKETTDLSLRKDAEIEIVWLSNPEVAVIKKPPG